MEALVLSILITILLALKTLTKGYEKMAQTITDLDLALATLNTELASLQTVVGSLSTLSAQLLTDVEALAAKAAPDLTNEVGQVTSVAQSLNSLSTTLETALSNLKATDQVANPAPPAAPSA